MVPAGYYPDSTIEAILVAINPGNYAVIDLTYFSSEENLGGAVDYIYRRIMKGLQYGNIRGYLTFDEPNCGGNPVPLETIRLWYRVIKALDPLRWIFVDYCTNECGIPNTSSVDNGGGYSYDSAMVNFYPYHYGWTDRTGVEKLRATAAHIKQYFHPSTWLWPINQAAYHSVGFSQDVLPCGDLGGNHQPDLRQHYDLSHQYEVWDDYGLFEQSHGIFYYGWGSNPEDKNLATDSFMLQQTRIMIAEHKRRYP